MSRVLYAIVAAVMLTGCVGSGVTIPREVKVSVAVPCIAPAEKPQRPVLLTDREILSLDSYRAAWALWGDRLELLGYAARLEAIADGCSRIPVTR